jgi:acetyl esterase/lipase
MTDIALALKPAHQPGKRRPMRHISYGALPRQTLDVYTPKAEARAIVLFIHGGGWVTGARWHYALLGHTLTQQGFACVVPDYHLYPQARFPSFVEDAARAFKWTHEHAAEIGGRRLPIFVMGHSAGAHIAALLALDADYLRAQGLSPDAIAGVIGLAGPYTLDPLKWPGVKDIFAASAAAPHSARPIKLARAGAPAMLLLHGASDSVVKSDASVNFASALTAAGSQANANIYPGIGHLGVLTSLLWGLRWRAGVLHDIGAFIAERQAR